MDDAAQTILLPTLVETLRMQAAQVEFKCGDLVGPYALSNDENAIRITLSNFTGEPMTLSIEANDVTRRVQSTPSPLLANCVVLQTGRLLQILFTKDIRSLEALRAILVADMNYRMEQETLENKKYECSNCHTAKFNSLENLKVHNELYCSGKVANEQEENGNGQNVILLPLAYHDFLQENAIKVMGPVHSVIPVAVGRRSTLINTQPMFVRNKTKLDMPPNLSISHSKLSIKIPIIDLDEKIPSASTPLDLSSPSRAQSIPSLSASCSPASKSSGSEPFYPDRPFSCTCGVSFSSQTTFDAHRQLYCSHTTRESTSRLAGSNRSSDVLLRKVSLSAKVLSTSLISSGSLPDYNLELWPQRVLSRLLELENEEKKRRFLGTGKMHQMRFYANLLFAAINAHSLIASDNKDVYVLSLWIQSIQYERRSNSHEIPSHRRRAKIQSKRQRFMRFPVSIATMSQS